MRIYSRDRTQWIDVADPTPMVIKNAAQLQALIDSGAITDEQAAELAPRIYWEGLTAHVDDG